VRLKLEEAFDILIHHSRVSLNSDVRSWYLKATGTHLSPHAILEGRVNIEAPNEIQIALQALRLSHVERHPLTDMVVAIHYPKFSDNTHTRNLALAH
jgi:hypothetical protein